MNPPAQPILKSMPSITIKNVEEHVLRRLREQAKKKNLSLNLFLRNLIAKTVGLEPCVRRFTDVSHLAGTWTEGDLKEFQKNTRSFREIDPELWR